MRGLRSDITISQLENIKKLLEKDEDIIYTFSVVPLDYRIVDFSTPNFYITDKHLLFAFDEAIEVYNLSDLEIGLIGNQPQFDLSKVVIEPTSSYSFDRKMELEKLKEDEGLTRLSLNESMQVPKYFLLREHFTIQKSYKTWALAQLLINVTNKKKENELLLEMLAGYFSTFNQKTVLYFVFAFIIYFIAKLVVGFNLPAIVSTILDAIFAVFMVFIGYWLWISVQKNFKRYEKYYLSYSSTN